MPTKFGAWVLKMLGMDDLLVRPQSVEDPEDGDAPQSTTIFEQTIGADRVQKYRIYDAMDEFDMVASMLDLLAEEATQQDYQKRQSVWVESQNPEVVEMAATVLANCKIEENIYPRMRRTAKYGDEWMRLMYAPTKGVMGWAPCPPARMTRIEDRFGRLIGFSQEETGSAYRGALKHRVSWPWDYIHFRMLGSGGGTCNNVGDEKYGTSYLRPMVRPWQQMVYSEDAVFMWRMRRASARDINLVDCGDMDPVERIEWLNRWRKAMKRTEYLDPSTGLMRHQFMPMTALDDIFIPIRKDDQTRIETKSGEGGVGDIYDLEYYVNKLAGAGRVPKAFIGFEGEVNAKATLSQQDIRYARTAKRGQRAMLVGLRRLISTHIVLVRDEAFLREAHNDFVVQMTPTSYLDELERLELVRQRNDIIGALSGLAQTMNLDARVWAIYILAVYARLPEELILRLVAKTSTPQEANELADKVTSLPGHIRTQLQEAVGKALDGKTEGDPLAEALASVLPSIRNEDMRRMIQEQTDPSFREDKSDASDHEGDSEWHLLQAHIKALRDGAPS